DRALGALARLRVDEVSGVQDAPDGRGARRLSTLALQVPGDRLRAGVQALTLEVAPQLDDASLELVTDRPGVALGSPGALLERVDAVLVVGPEQPVQVLP